MVIPVIVLGIELIAAIALFFAGLAGRLLFRRPWTIRARAPDRATLTRHVAGFRHSGRVRDRMAAALAAGEPVRPS